VKCPNCYKGNPQKLAAPLLEGKPWYCSRCKAHFTQERIADYAAFLDQLQMRGVLKWHPRCPDCKNSDLRKQDTPPQAERPWFCPRCKHYFTQEKVVDNAATFYQQRQQRPHWKTAVFVFFAIICFFIGTGVTAALANDNHWSMSFRWIVFVCVWAVSGFLFLLLWKHLSKTAIAVAMVCLTVFFVLYIILGLIFAR